MAFASYSDVEARWRTLSADERAKATALLEDASVILKGSVSVDPEDADQAAALNMVSCNMVIRSLRARASDAFGVDQMSSTMGPFAQTEHFTNPNGDLYLTKGERTLLGISGGRGRVLSPSYGPEARANA